jgi:hypothetical protein
MLNGRYGAAIALREVLRELYPAALRAYPDPAHPLALAVLDALPEPGRLTGRGADPTEIAEEVVAELTRAGTGTEDQVTAAVTALVVAINESPRRGGVNKSLAPAAADTVRQAIGAVRCCDNACEALLGTLRDRAGTPAAAGAATGRRARRAVEPAAVSRAASGHAPADGSRRCRRATDPYAAGQPAGVRTPATARHDPDRPRRPPDLTGHRVPVHHQRRRDGQGPCRPAAHGDPAAAEPPQRRDRGERRDRLLAAAARPA